MRDWLYRWTHGWTAIPAARESLEAFLIDQSGPWMAWLGVGWVSLALLAGPALRRVWREIPWPGRLGGLGVVTLGVLLRALSAPRGPQVFFDEFNFLEAARELALSGLYMVPDPFGEGRVLPVPPAWPVVLSWSFSAWSPSIEAVALAACLLSCATLPLLFLATWLLFERWLPACLATLGLAVLPIHLRMSGSAALETGSLFFMLATLLALLMLRREPGLRWGLLAGASAAWWMNWRMEGPFVLAPGLLGLYLALDPERARRVRQPSFWLILAGALVAALPAVVADLHGAATDFYLFYEGAEVQAAKVSMNLAGNLVYWFDGRVHPRLFTFLALVGLWTWRPRREALAWGGWWLGLHLFYSLNPSGDFGARHTLDSWRVALHPALAVLLLGAAGAEAIWLRVRTSGAPRRLRVMAVASLALWLGVPWQLRAFIHERHLWMHEWASLEQAGARLPSAGARLLLGTGPGGQGALGSPLLRRAMMGYATRGPAELLLLTQEAFRSPGEGPVPQLLIDLQIWTEVAQERVFLYHVQHDPLFPRPPEGGEPDRRRLQWLQEFVGLRVVAGRADPLSRISFTLFEVTGLSPSGRRWLDTAGVARPVIDLGG